MVLTVSLKTISLGAVCGQVHRCDQVSFSISQAIQFHEGSYMSGFLRCNSARSGSSFRNNLVERVKALLAQKEVSFLTACRSWCKQNHVHSQLRRLALCWTVRLLLNRESEINCRKNCACSSSDTNVLRAPSIVISAL